MPTRLDLVALVVRDYDEAIAFFVDLLGFRLEEDAPATTTDGRASTRAGMGREEGPAKSAGPGRAPPSLSSLTTIRREP